MPAETPTEALTARPTDDQRTDRAEWIAAVEKIADDAEAWATEQKWFVHRGPKEITEPGLGTYEVPTVLIQAPAGRFVIDPIARYVMGAEGRLDFCVFPSYYYFMIIRTEAGWQFETNPRTTARPWTKQTFLEVISELARMA